MAKLKYKIYALWVLRCSGVRLHWMLALSSDSGCVCRPVCVTVIVNKQEQRGTGRT